MNYSDKEKNNGEQEGRYSEIELAAKKYFAGADVSRIELPDGRHILDKVLRTSDEPDINECIGLLYMAACAISIIVLYVLFVYGGASMGENDDKLSRFSIPGGRIVEIPSTMNGISEPAAVSMPMMQVQSSPGRILAMLIPPCAALSGIVLAVFLILYLLIISKFERKHVCF